MDAQTKGIYDSFKEAFIAANCTVTCPLAGCIQKVNGKECAIVVSAYQVGQVLRY